MGPQTRVELLIFQATPFCNINCSYCYLPNRLSTARISTSVVHKAARSIVEAGWVHDRISVVWHAGEPLTVGAGYLEGLIDACEPLTGVSQVQHCIQTNAILIDGASRNSFGAGTLGSALASMARAKCMIGIASPGPAKAP
jgi:uncharacterized protein